MGGCIVSKEIPNKILGLVWMPGLGFGTQYKFSTVSGVSSEEIRIYLRKLRQGAKEVSPIWLHKYEQNQLFFFSGTTVEELSRTIFQGSTSSSTLSRRVRSADKDSANLPDGIESLEGFVMGLYQEVFNAIIYIINRSISTTAVANNTIFVLDTPGFQVRSSGV